MKKILFIIPYIPYPLNSGGNQAFFNMVDYLRHQMEVSLLLCAFSSRDEENITRLKEIWPDVSFYVFRRRSQFEALKPKLKHPRYYRWLEKVGNSVSRKMRRQVIQVEDHTRNMSVLPNSLFSDFEYGYVDYVGKVSRQGFDMIQVEFYELVALGYILPKEVDTIFVHHELRYVRNENELSLFKERSLEDELHFRVAQDFERGALKAFKYIIALTEVDRKLLIDFLGREDRIFASPAVVHFKASKTLQFEPAIDHRFTFVGYGYHYPNVDAVLWFCRKIAPCLRKHHFKFKLQVVGEGYASYEAQLKKQCPEVEFLGYVDDLKPVLLSSVALVPIRIGSGMRMKILDMISLGIPFITTSKGVEGIQLQHGQDCLMADTAEDIAQSMIQLAGDQELQRNLVRSAHARLDSLYKPQEMLEKRWQVYQQICQGAV